MASSGDGTDLSVQLSDESKGALVEMLELSQTFMTFITSDAGTIEYASQAAQSVLGFDPAALIGQNAWSLMHPDDIARVRAGLAAVQERGGLVSSNQYRRQHKEGHYVYVSGCSYLKQGRFYVQEHSIDSEIRRQSIEEKQTYIGTTAHDLKTPVAVFQSSLDLLQQSKLTEEQDAITQQAQAAVDLMQMTVDQAMEVGKLRAGEPIKPSLGSVDVRVLLDRCKTLLEGALPSAASPDVALTTQVADGIQGQIITDRCWLWQMTMSYLTNAYKFTHSGEIKLVVRLAGGQNGRFLRFEVHDTGIGVEAAQRDSLFVPWNGNRGATSSSSVHTPRAVGAARLGLYSVKVKSEQLGGSCGYEAKAAPEQGSVFYFQVPYIPEGQRFENQFERMQHMASNAIIKGAESDAPPATATAVADTSAGAGAAVAAAGAQPSVAVPAATAGSSGSAAKPPKLSALQRSMQAARSQAATAGATDGATSSNGSSSTSAAVQRHLSGASTDTATTTESESSTTAAAAAAAEQEAAAAAAAAAVTGPTALVIDDTGSVRKLLCKTLEGKGLRCDVARNGLEGLHMMRCKRYSVVLCDAFMPVMGGMECIQRFRQWEE
eukprot:13137-Heterococcus_DN1.PRE.1